MQTKPTFIIIILSIIVLSACEDLFDYSPYETEIRVEDQDQWKENISALQIYNDSEADSFSFVAISDSHLDYYQLEKAIKRINTMQGIDFVVHLGDMTDQGWLSEYELFSDYISGLHLPILTCIGNHDYLSNGEKIYNSMFGTNNYFILFKNVKLVFFDGTTLESNKSPDFEWLRNQLTGSNQPVIIFSHVPPRGEQYTKKYSDTYRKLLIENNVMLSVHGHEHIHYYDDMLSSGTNMLITGSVGNKNLCRINIRKDGSYSYQMIPF